MLQQKKKCEKIKKAENGSVKYQYEVGHIFLKGLGVKKDAKKAFAQLDDDKKDEKKDAKKAAFNEIYDDEKKAEKKAAKAFV